MSKVLLIVDMPDEEYKVFDIYKDQEMIVDIGFCHDDISGWSFLRKILLCAKQIPEKKPISRDRGKNHCEYSLLDRLEYQKGFNDCIEEILGG